MGLAALLLAAGCSDVPAAPPPGPRVELPPFRASAVPLFVQTPYLNTWLCGDRLADEVPKLWNGQLKGMVGMLQIDGKPYRFMGLPGSPLPALRQDSVRILPTRTVFEFSQDDLRLRLEFLSPTIPRDLRLLSLPVGLLRAEVSSKTPRRVQLYLDITGEWAVGSSEQRITWDGLFRIRPSEPRLFHETHHFPDWGDVHWVAVDPATSVYGIQAEVRGAFAGGASARRDTRYPRSANDDWPVFAHTWDLGRVSAPVVRRAAIGHLRREVVDFYGSSCLAYWTRTYRDGTALMAAVAGEFESIRAAADAVDQEVLSRARDAGGAALATLGALAFRQSFAANELALRDHDTFYFSKSMDLVGPSALQSLDVLYPASCALLAFNPALLRMQIAPIFEALRRGDWKEAQAMADLGTYPVASGQTSSGAPPAQTTAELVLLARMAGGFEKDPVFAELQHALADAPATVRAALALAPELPPAFRLALEAPRDRLRPELFVDRLLGLRAFPPDAVSTELVRLREELGRYGAPYEFGRRTVRTDALLWLAALADPAGCALIAEAPLRFYAETSSRVPAPDLYEVDGSRTTGPQARPVLGAVFAPLVLRAAPNRR